MACFMLAVYWYNDCPDIHSSVLYYTFVSMACRSIGSKWNMPMELAFDLCTLALYDIAIYADDSTSMKFAEGMLQSV